jgi:hypothetical protein
VRKHNIYYMVIIVLEQEKIKRMEQAQASFPQSCKLVL